MALIVFRPIALSVENTRDVFRMKLAKLQIAQEMDVRRAYVYLPKLV
jgi:hypothetical protein